ncbi:MAG: hypothetical protein ACR2NZ_07820 [Rubripirellula sp.]
MRFLSPHRSPKRRTHSVRPWGRYRHPTGDCGELRRGRFASCSRKLRQRVVWTLLIVASLTFGRAGAQPPGTTPTRDVFSQQDRADAQGLPIRAFMFLSESDNVVLMPGLTWEEFERLSNLDSGVDSTRQAYSYQSLSVTGDTDRERAEMDVTLRLSIAPTEGRWVSIPLRMGNFHRLAPPDVSGVDEYFMTLAPDESGHLLFVKTSTQQDALLRMRVSARVETSSAARMLEFQLPDVPSKVDLRVDAMNISGEVIGRGDETIVTESESGRRTQFSVESGGGNYSLRWGSLARSTDNLPVLEAESRVSVRWDSPEDQPIASVRLTVKNVRGSIESFQLRLPRGAVVLETPRLGTGGETIELGAPTKDREGEIREVIIPEQDQESRIDLNFDLQLENDNASATSPLPFRVPEVVGSLRHRGEVEVRTGGDYRLRWLTKPWVRGELGESSDETATTGRSYRFRFDRASFDLPLWLGEKERQLRMTNSSQITVHESMASLETTIQINGQVPDGRLQFDDAGWQINAIENMETGEALDSFDEKAYRIIEMGTNSTEDLAQIRILAELPLIPEGDLIQFALPSVIDIDNTALVQKSTLDLINSGRTMLVVDLDASSGVNRLVPTIMESTESPVTSFQVQSQDASPIITGTMVEQPPRIILASDANIELDGDQLRTTVDWTVSSTLDLEGVLPIRIPSLGPLGVPNGSDGSDLVPPGEDGAVNAPTAADPMETASDLWVVTVNDLPAQLRALDDDRYELISDRLAMGSMSIRWRHVKGLEAGSRDGATETVALPSPNIADVTIRGTMQVTLRGSQQLDLVSADRDGTNRLELVSLPRDPLRLKLQTRLTAREELAVRQTVLRTVVGRNMRHERVLAQIQGGESFRVGLPDTAQDVSVRAFIDGAPRTVRREGNTLNVLLPGDKGNHVVDLQVWVALTTAASFATVEPTLRLPVGVGRVQWQIVAPLDAHVVWASPTLGRSMTWRFDDWRLYREASRDDRSLLAMAGTDNTQVIPGNRYLYIGSDLRSFEVVVVSRVVLWIMIGSVVIFSAVMLTNFPRVRHPLTAVVLAVFFGGLLAIAPDAAVLAGQFGIIALVLVIVMIAIRALITPTRTDRVFSSTTPPTEDPNQPSTRTLKQTGPPGHTGTSTTQALPPPSPTEAAP